MTLGAGDGALGVVDGEVVAGEPSSNLGFGERDRFDHLGVFLVAELGAHRPGSVCRIRQHGETLVLAVQQVDTDRAVRDVGCGQRRCGNDPRFGLDRDVGLIAIAIRRPRLMHVPGFGVDGRDHPVFDGAVDDPPRPVLAAGLDILTRHQRQQPDRIHSSIIEIHISNGVQHGNSRVLKKGVRRFGSR